MSEAWNSGCPKLQTNDSQPWNFSGHKCMNPKLELHPDFKECSELLLSHGVGFAVIGGYAVAAHGRPRYTGDIDFFVRKSVA